MNIKEKAEQYARERWGIFYKEPYPVIASDKSIGEISAKDYTNGYNEAKRWIPVGKRLPETLIGGITLELNVVLCKLKNGIIVSAIYYEQKKEWAMYGLDITINDAIEWREI